MVKPNEATVPAAEEAETDATETTSRHDPRLVAETRLKLLEIGLKNGYSFFDEPVFKDFLDRGQMLILGSDET